jgi:hypothetical protein
MTQNKKTRMNHWKQESIESIGRFLLSQLTHTAITLSVLALLLLGARQVGALNGLLAPAAPNVGNSATTINYQGRLADESGASLNGQYDLKFAIYDAAEDGAMIWPTDGEPELHEDVTVSDGLFSVGLGSRTTGGVPTNVWSGDRYLQVWVESEELAPRELLRSVPIAGMALTVPDGAITSEKLDFHVPQLLGQKTCDSCGDVEEPDKVSWFSVKGADAQDIIAVTATTQGGDILVQMTARYGSESEVTQWCGIKVRQNGETIRLAHLDGQLLSNDLGCSGSYLFTDLDAGTYTFNAVGYTSSKATVTWRHQRQIVVYEF